MTHPVSPSDKTVGCPVLPNATALLHPRRTARRLLGVLALSATSPVWAGEPEWYVNIGGFSHHFQPTQAPGRQWQEQHPGLGLERRTTNEDGWSFRSTAGAIQDSRGFWGSYAGAAYLRTWRWGAAEAGLGAGAYAFYRSVSWNGKMTLTPGLLPTASLSFPADSVSVSLILVPPLGGKGNDKAMPAVLHAQMSVRFR